MKSSELACPHCSSILNFGGEIAAGRRVECLICMQSFVAQATAQPTTAAVSEATRPVPKIKPGASAKHTISGTDGCCPGWRIASFAAAAAFFFVVIGGVAFAVWKNSGPAQPAEVSPDPNPPAVVVNTVTEPNPPPESPPQSEAPSTPKNLQKIPLVRANPAKTNLAEEASDPTAVMLTRKVERPVVAWGLSQEKIDASIDRGLAHLRKTQHPWQGAWVSTHPIGYTALAGLTMLECNVPRSDPAVKRAAAFIRNRSPLIDHTYELSLAILFLDRLGDPTDRVRIQGMALRLLAGQNDCGGWTYLCPPLDGQEMLQLYTFLQANKPLKLNNALSAGEKPLSSALSKETPLGNAIGPIGTQPNDPFVQLHKLILQNGIDGSYATPPKNASSGPATAGNDPAKVALDPEKLKHARPVRPAAKVPLRADMLKQNLRGVPIVRNQGKAKHKIKVGLGLGDNSNTQFALLALWAARRHDLPTDPALLLAYQRFFNSQLGDGGWAYTPDRPLATHTMTCVGLLGLAMGHGAAPELVDANPKNPMERTIKPALEDAHIQKGLKALAAHIGEPALTERNFAMKNLYFLWSVERVAVLYDLKMIDGKDWYGWGAQILVHNQFADGSWGNSVYPGASGHTNTCLALLFLKRSNLVQDLTNNIRLQTPIAKTAD